MLLVWNFFYLKKLFRYETKITLSEAIILSAIDINKPGVALKIEEYRLNRFSELWKSTFYGGNNWTAQYRSELNQGTGRIEFLKKLQMENID